MRCPRFLFKPVDSAAPFGESESPAPMRADSRENGMTWGIVFTGIAIMIIFPALSFLITMKVYKR